MKPLSEYKRSNEFNTWYEDENDCYYDDLGSLLQCQIIGHCGCGNPENNLKLIYDMLIINKRQRDEPAPSYVGNKWNEHCKKHNDEYKTYIIENWKRFRDFFFYVMTDKDIMEHGGSIPGWVCDHNFEEALKVWHDTEYKNE